jgi:hypothetical protein
MSAAPLPDRIVAAVTGRAIAWLARRALRRRDFKEFNHMLVALLAGNTDAGHLLDLPVDRALKPGDPIVFAYMGSASKQETVA